MLLNQILKYIKTYISILAFTFGLIISGLSQNDGDIVWKKFFGGKSVDVYNSVTAVFDGIIAVGRSDSDSFGNEDWKGFNGNGDADAIIVKYDNDGNVVWQKRFGGAGKDRFSSVTTVSDGIIAVGCSHNSSFGNGDWENVNGKGNEDAIIVKYDNNGNVVWKKNFGGGDDDFYNTVIVVFDGIIAVGCSDSGSFGSEDWKGVNGNGDTDAIIVKYDNDGNVVWQKRFGGAGKDKFSSVTTVSDGVIAVGGSDDSSFGNGDWENVNGNGNGDAIIVKYDHNGNVIWQKKFGGKDEDSYNSVIAVADGFVAVGNTIIGPSQNRKGNAIIVKYDNNGDTIWIKTLGGVYQSFYCSVIDVFDGIIVAGTARIYYVDIHGAGAYADMDAILIKYDNDGNTIWEKRHSVEDEGRDGYWSLTRIDNDIIAVGVSYRNFFDAIIVKYKDRQKATNFEIFNKLSYTKVLRISVKYIEDCNKYQNYNLVSYFEEYLIYYKYTRDEHFEFTREEDWQLKIHIRLINLNIDNRNIDTVIVLEKTQEKKFVSHLCNFIYNNKIPDEYIGEIIPEPSSVSVIYTIEVNDKKYTFTDRKLLSLATLILYNKNNWHDVDY